MTTSTKKFDLFQWVNSFFLFLIALLCMVPFLHVLALSFSSKDSILNGDVTFWPADFTLSSYRYVIGQTAFWQALVVTLKRVSLGVALNMVLTLLAAYPLSKSNRQFTMRTKYAWFFFLTLLFSGGLIPTYMVVLQTNLIDSIFALVIPTALPVFNVVLLLNFFRSVPTELEEAALMDGANQWTILWKIYVPLSLPALATLVLFSAVGHWNTWFDGIIYMNRPEHYPLQSFLRSVITMPNPMYLSSEEFMSMKNINDRSVRAAQIFIGALPILLVYPFLQKYFVKGMTIGSVKG